MRLTLGRTHLGGRAVAAHEHVAARPGVERQLGHGARGAREVDAVLGQELELARGVVKGEGEEGLGAREEEAPAQPLARRHLHDRRGLAVDQHRLLARRRAAAAAAAGPHLEKSVVEGALDLSERGHGHVGDDEEPLGHGRHKGRHLARPVLHHQQAQRPAARLQRRRAMVVRVVPKGAPLEAWSTGKDGEGGSLKSPPSPHTSLAWWFPPQAKSRVAPCERTAPSTCRCLTTEAALE